MRTWSRPRRGGLPSPTAPASRRALWRQPGAPAHNTSWRTFRSGQARGVSWLRSRSRCAAAPGSGRGGAVGRAAPRVARAGGGSGSGAGAAPADSPATWVACPGSPPALHAHSLRDGWGSLVSTRSGVSAVTYSINFIYESLREKRCWAHLKLAVYGSYHGGCLPFSNSKV